MIRIYILIQITKPFIRKFIKTHVKYPRIGFSHLQSPKVMMLGYLVMCSENKNQYETNEGAESFESSSSAEWSANGLGTTMQL